MEKMADLKDLMKHEIKDLMSAEDQIIEALPMMIEKAKNNELKKRLRQHLKVTEEQRKRLDKVMEFLGEDGQSSGSNGSLFSRLFSDGEKCKGMEGLITEGEKVMSKDMNEEVLDAAIIASAQKIEHYEISSYGTAKAFAQELQMQEVERLLDQTLKEEYEADVLLTQMGMGKVNPEAMMTEMNFDGNSGSRSNGTAKRSSSKRSSSSSNKKSSSSKKSRSKSSRSSAKSSGRSSSKKNSGKSPGKTRTSSKNRKSRAKSK